jgi:excisionase family DNA binding protein
MTAAAPERVDLSAGALLDADDVASLLGIRRSTVYELSRRRYDPLPRIKLGKAVRFHRQSVEEWLGRQTG